VSWAQGGIVLCLILVGIWLVAEWIGARREYRDVQRRERVRAEWKARVTEGQSFWRDNQ
jgi:hypothetical protein